MIGYLEGLLRTKNPESGTVTLLVQGVGYEITVPRILFEQLEPPVSASLWIHTHVREDQLTLFGFRNENEKNLFRTLLSVSGLGPKTALSLLSEHSPERLIQYILAKDSDAVSEAPGVGKKLAQKIILELATKLEKLAWVSVIQKSALIPAQSNLSIEDSLRTDLLSALSHLGFTTAQIKSVLDSTLSQPDLAEAGFESCLKAALSELTGRTRPKPTEVIAHG